MPSPANGSRRRRWLAIDPSYVPAFEEKVFVEGPGTSRRLVNFFFLLIAATVIANYGLLAASTATVIGAMIVAPLMGPIMATAAAVVMGLSRRALAALALVGVGALAVVGLAWLLTLAAPGLTISFTDNPELASRVSPDLYALLTALGAGAAGAFIMTRQELADSMGGVAIAISLVPPLCVVGIAASQGQWPDAAGALLLFTTNFLAILLAGGLVFLLAGLGAEGRQGANRMVRARSFAVILLGTVLVAVPLTVNGYQAVENAYEDEQALDTVQAWLGDGDNRALSATVDESLVLVTVEQAATLPATAILASRLAAALKRPVDVRLRKVPMDMVHGGPWGAPPGP